MSLSRDVLREVCRAYVMALPPYFAWEMLQMPAYTGMPASWWLVTAWCAMATLADAAVTAGLVALGAVAFGQARWFAPPSLTRYATVVTVGVAIHVVAEWIMVRRFGWFGYRQWHLLVPGLDVGVLPVVQPLVILPLVFAGLAWCRDR